MITLSKIAKLANVSVSTASKAFSGSSEVNSETRELIFAIAKENKCFKKFYNAKYGKLVIAIIAPEFKSSYYTHYLSCLQGILCDMGCELCVSTTDFSVEKERALLEYYYKHSGVDGIIIINSKAQLPESYEIPVVLISPKEIPENVPVVGIDSSKALSDIADHLVFRGITSLGFIGEALTEKKFLTFKSALAEKGIDLPEGFVCVTDKRFEAGGYEAAKELISRGDLPRAIICAYDSMAIGAIRCLLDHGLRVPEDVAVLGSDNIPEGAYLNPPLSTVSSRIDDLCSIAADVILKKINDEETKGLYTVNSEFILRRSFEID